MDVTFVAELESIFRESFLKSAPLYQAAGKIKLPYEDIKGQTVLYRGSLREESRAVEKIADYELFHIVAENPDIVRQKVRELAVRAGHAVDGLLRLENVRTALDQDPRNVRDLKVTDIFDHPDGRRNLQLAYNYSYPGMDPAGLVAGWVFYKFYFAAASIKQEYKN